MVLSDEDPEPRGPLARSGMSTASGEGAGADFDSCCAALEAAGMRTKAKLGAHRYCAAESSAVHSVVHSAGQKCGKKCGKSVGQSAGQSAEHSAGQSANESTMHAGCPHVPPGEVQHCNRVCAMVRRGGNGRGRIETEGVGESICTAR